MLPELNEAQRLDAGSKSLAAPPASWLAPGKGHRHPGSEWAANDKKRERERESVEGGRDNTIVSTSLCFHPRS